MSPGSKVEATCDELNADDRKALSARSVAFLMPNPPCLTGREDCVHASWSNLMLIFPLGTSSPDHTLGVLPGF